jgi:phytoene dehydrogenase-like protein
VAVVVVVGAGVGGLAAAVRLAAAGHDVTVCEQAPEVGGKLGWYTRGGFSFDTGPSLLTMPHVFDDLFAAAGADLRDAVDLHHLDPITRYRFADGTTVDAHADDTAFAAELDSRLGDGAGSAWQRLDAHAARIWAVAEQPFLRSAVSATALARLAVHRPRDLATVAPGRTLRHLGRRYLADPRLRMFLDRYATYAGSDPRRAPAALAAIGHVERRYGGWYVRGGLHRLATALAELARARGARIHCATPVTAITRTAGGRVDGVRLADGGHLAADIVVANADAAQVYGTLIDDPRSRARVRRLPPSMAGFVLLLALTGQRPHNYSAYSARRRRRDHFFPAPGVPAGSAPSTGMAWLSTDRERRGPRRSGAERGIIGGGAIWDVREADTPESLCGRTPGFAHHTVMFPADYDAEFDAVFGGRLVADPTIYVSAPPDPALAPSGCGAWFVLVNAAPHVPHAAPHATDAARHATDTARHASRSTPDAADASPHAARHASGPGVAGPPGGAPATTVGSVDDDDIDPRRPGCESRGQSTPFRPLDSQPTGPMNVHSRSTSRSRARGLGIDWDRPGLADAYARHILNLLAARGLDVRDRLLWYEVRTPADLERSTGTVGGSIYGPSSNGPRAAFLRPANASPIPGLFLVGGSSHPGGGLPLVAMSAHLVADLIGPA